MAISYVPMPATGTSSNPRPFICNDGKTYWLKASAGQGLAAELIGGRLASQVKAGPGARAINVPAEALPEDGSANHVLGLVVGIEDQRNCVNARDLEPFITNGQFDPAKVDVHSRARVVVFQSWVGVGDQQVMVNLTNGVVMSLDHGECFGSVDAPDDPTAVVTSIPGVPDETGRERPPVNEMVKRIEGLTDDDLMTAVAGVPSGDAWNSDPERRLKIARWLAHRRHRIREVMTNWLKNP
jgi:hypothetical protein